MEAHASCNETGVQVSYPGAEKSENHAVLWNKPVVHCEDVFIGLITGQ